MRVRHAKFPVIRCVMADGSHVDLAALARWHGPNSPRRLRRMSNNDAGRERWRPRVAVAVVVGIIVIAVVMIRVL